MTLTIELETRAAVDRAEHRLKLATLSARRKLVLSWVTSRSGFPNLSRTIEPETDCWR